MESSHTMIYQKHSKTIENSTDSCHIEIVYPFSFKNKTPFEKNHFSFGSQSQDFGSFNSSSFQQNPKRRKNSDIINTIPNHFQKMDQSFKKIKTSFINNSDDRSNIIHPISNPLLDRSFSLLEQLSENQIQSENKPNFDIFEINYCVFDFIRDLLLKPFEMKINFSNISDFLVQNWYIDKQTYCNNFLNLTMDEIKANFIQMNKNNERKKKEIHDCKILSKVRFIGKLVRLKIELQESNKNIPKKITFDKKEIHKNYSIIRLTFLNFVTNEKHVLIGITIPEKINSNSDFLQYLPFFPIHAIFAEECVPDYFFDNRKYSIKVEYFCSFISFRREIKTLLRIRSQNSYLGQIMNYIIFGKLSDFYSSENKVSNMALNSSKLFLKLNDSQKSAVDKSINDMKPITLIHGPPGTGKTQSIIALLDILSQMPNSKRKKILVCTPSNGSLEHILSELEKSLSLFDYLKNYKIVQNIKNPPKKTEKKIKTNFSKSTFLQNKKNEINIDFLKILADQKKLLILNRLKIIKIGVVDLETRPNILPFCMENIVNLLLSKKELLEKFISDLKNLEKELKTAIKIGWFHTSSYELLLEEIKQEIDLFQATINENIDKIKYLLIKNAVIVFSTLNSSGKYEMSALQNNVSFLIIDESTQASEVSALIPINLNPDRLIMLGDPLQLPATLCHPYKKELKFNRSLMERLMDNGYCADMLDVQYRMHPQIASFPNSQFYENRIQNSDQVCDYERTPKGIQLFSKTLLKGDRCRFFNCEGFTHFEKESLRNQEESNFIVKLLISLQNYGIDNIGVISYYKEQVLTLVNAVRTLQLDAVEIDTVDSYQGRQKDVIIVSAVRSINECEGGLCSIGFLSDQRRLNVSITRAKHLFFFIGNKETLSQDSNFMAFVGFLEKEKCVQSCPDFEKMIKSQMRINL